MGYYIDQIDSEFEIKAANVPFAWNALKQLFSPNNGTIVDSSGIHFSWIESKDVVNAPTFAKAMSESRWDIETNDAGDVTGIWFNGEKYGDDDLVLGQIAPFVEDGSYIIMQGEDGERWKWKFKDGIFSEVRGRFVFDDEEG